MGGSGWNKPSANQPRKAPKKPSAMRGIVAGLVVVAVAAVCIFLFVGKGEKSVEKAEKKPARIKEVTPAPAPAPKAKVEEAPAKPMTALEKKKAERAWRRSVAITNGYEVTYPNDPGVVRLLTRKEMALPFETFPDNEIASVLSIKPGDIAIMIDLPYDFDKQFANSLLTPIKVTPEDSPERAALKEQVLAVRKELIAAVKRGESPREILMEERKRLHNMMGIRDNYERMVREAIERGAPDQEIADTVTAANKLLEKQEIDNPIRLPFKTKLRIDRKRATGEVVD